MMDLDISFKAVASVSLILFSVIDIIGSIPIIIDLREKEGKIQSGKATVVAGVIMILFLIVGTQILSLFGIDVSSFAIAGAIILFLLGIEMILGVVLFRSEADEGGTGSIVPLAFPLIAGAGTMTTIISLKSEYSELSILLGIVINLIFVYIVLKSSGWIQRKLGQGGANILRKVFGIILLAIAIKLFKTNI